MIGFLRISYLFVLAAMFAVTTWASKSAAIWNIPPQVIGHPWFVATLFDTYFAFLIFYCWVAYKERSVIARICWFVLIMTLGNFAIAAYMLWKLFRLPAHAKIEDLLLRSK